MFNSTLRKKGIDKPGSAPYNLYYNFIRIHRKDCEGNKTRGTRFAPLRATESRWLLKTGAAYRVYNSFRSRPPEIIGRDA